MSEEKVAPTELRPKERTRSKTERRSSASQTHKSNFDEGSKTSSSRKRDVARADPAKRTRDVNPLRLSAVESLLLYFLNKLGTYTVSDETRHPNPMPSAKANIELEKLIPLLYELFLLQKALEEAELSEEHRRSLEETRGLGARTIMDTVKALIDVDPTCVSYAPEGEVVVSLGHGLEVAIFQGFVNRPPKHRLRGKAVKWMIDRGEGRDLNNLPAAIERSMAAGVTIPERCFGLWRTVILIQDNPRYTGPPL